MPWGHARMGYDRTRLNGTKIKCYDSGPGKYLDRYTIVLYSKDWDAAASPGCHSCISFGDDSFWGFGSCKGGSHLGKRVEFKKLPTSVKIAARCHTKEEER